jgi:hypothetical protein
LLAVATGHTDVVVAGIAFTVLVLKAPLAVKGGTRIVAFFTQQCGTWTTAINTRFTSFWIEHSSSTSVSVTKFIRVRQTAFSKTIGVSRVRVAETRGTIGAGQTTLLNFAAAGTLVAPTVRTRFVAVPVLIVARHTSTGAGETDAGRTIRMNVARFAVATTFTADAATAVHATFMGVLFFVAATDALVTFAQPTGAILVRKTRQTIPAGRATVPSARFVVGELV